MPCEKFSRATLMPAPIICRIVASSDEAGPRVQTNLGLLPWECHRSSPPHRGRKAGINLPACRNAYGPPRALLLVPVKAPAESGRAYRALFVAVFSAMLGLGIVIPLLPRYAETLGATGLEIGAIFAGFSISRALLMPVFGRLSDRRGRKRFIVLGLSLYTVLSLAYLAANSVAGLIAVRMVHGVASAMVIPIAMAYVADLSAVGGEGSHMGTFSISLYLGMGIGPLAGGVISATAGMAAVFLAMTAFSLFSVAICIAFVPETGVRPRPPLSGQSVLGHPGLARRRLLPADQRVRERHLHGLRPADRLARIRPLHRRDRARDLRLVPLDLGSSSGGRGGSRTGTTRRS